MHLVHQNAKTEHQVTYYAQKLYISSRYLHEITVLYAKGKTPKDIIDEQITTEIAYSGAYPFTFRRSIRA